MSKINVPINELNVCNVIKNDMLKVDRFLEKMLRSEHENISSDLKQRKETVYGYAVTDFNHDTLAMDLLSAVVHSLQLPNIRCFRDLFNRSTASIDIGDENMAFFSEFVDKNKSTINKVFGSRIKKSNKKLKSIWDLIIGSAGIPIKYNKKKKVYSTDIQTYAFVLKKQLGEIYSEEDVMAMSDVTRLDLLRMHGIGD